MCNIALIINDESFQYDVYTLVKAFYPKEQVGLFLGDKKPPSGEFQVRLRVTVEKDGLRVVLKRHGELFDRDEKYPEDIDRKEVKNILKRSVYNLLKDFLGIKLPWGTLTGIRPTKIPMGMLEKGVGNPEIAKYMREAYYVSPEKASLCIAVANREKEILDSLDLKKGYCLYVGIPFCPSVCLYCSFGSHPMEKFGYLAGSYLTAMYREIDYVAKKMKDKKLLAVYIGGGTPTTLNVKQLDELLTKIEKSFDTSHVREYTVEAGRPDTIDEEKLRVILSHRADRISVNPQSMNQKTLDIIGRNHSVEDIVDAFHLVRDMGCTNINMDMILGLPGEGEEEIVNTLKEIENLSPNSLTCHSLALKRGTGLNLRKEEYRDNAFFNSQKIMRTTEEYACKMNMEPYYLYRQKNIAGNLENIGFAERGKFGIYNILIMEEKVSIMAVGSNASTKFVYPEGKIERAENVKDIYNYIDRIDEMIERKEKYFNGFN